MSDTTIEFRVGLTDSDWFEYFRRHRNLTEMNFWRPGRSRTKAERGTLWAFLLRSNIIAGCAFVEVTSSLPLSVAWRAFERANGFDTREEFFARLRALRSGDDAHTDFEIGCVGLIMPTFFDEPFDFAPYQSTWTNKSNPNKNFSTDAPEGAALWEQIQSRLSVTSAVASPLVAGESPLLVQRLLNLRLGQGGFRTRIIDAYGRRCAISGERSLPALEAAHIKPFTLVKEHRTSNGILLRADIHKLFDAGYVSVSPDLKFRVSASLRDDYSNGRIYYELNGRDIRAPESAADRPDPDYLEWHYCTIFRKDAAYSR